MDVLVQTVVGRLRVAVAGDGPPMMLWPSLFLDSAMHRSQVEAFKGSFTVLSVDGPGHGGSSITPRRFSIDACARAAAEILRSRSLAPAVFVGTSWGGLVGAKLAADFPDLVSALVVSGAPFDPPTPSERAANRGLALAFRAFGGWRGFQRGIQKRLFSPRFLRDHPGRVAEANRALRTADRGVMAPAIRSVLVHRGSTLEDLPRIRCATLLVAGELDRAVPPARTAAHGRMIPGSRFETLADCGHLAPIEGAEQFNALVRRFLDRAQTGPAALNGQEERT